MKLADSSSAVMELGGKKRDAAPEGGVFNLVARNNAPNP